MEDHCEVSKSVIFKNEGAVISVVLQIADSLLMDKQAGKS